MDSRSRSLRRCALGLIVGATVAFDPGGLSSLRAQEPAPRTKSDIPKEGPSAAKDPEARLRAQKLQTRKARAAYEIARLRRELAEIAVEEYAEGIYTQDLATVEGEIKLAESDRVRAEDRLVWADRMHQKGFVSKATLVSEQLNLKKTKYALEQAQSKKTVLLKYTHDKTIKGLRAEVRKAHDDELARKAALNREQADEAELERQLDRT